MRKYLLPHEGKFYKANLHCHSNISDGKLSPEEIKKSYMEHGYSVVAYTDHDVLISHADLAEENFLPLNGFEMEVNEEVEGDFINKKTCHMCFIAIDKDNLIQPCYHRTKFVPKCSEASRPYVKYDESKPDFERVYSHEGISEMMKEGRENGFFVTYNHPSWSLEGYENYIGYNNMNAMEIYNYSCITLGYPEYNEKEYDDMLRAGKRIYCIAADDNHNHHEHGTQKYDSFGGFIMIKAEKLEYNTITNALVNGEFYASQGPEIHDLYYEDGKVYIKCSNADSIRLNTGRRTSKIVFADNAPVNEAVFEVSAEDNYIRLTVTDKTGKHAATNAYFMDEIL